jgi:hypothetical protein
MPQWYQWETPWRGFTFEGRPWRMRVEYGLDQVNDPPLFHFNQHNEEKLRNNRWTRASRAPDIGLPTSDDIFPELRFVNQWSNFRPSEEPTYLSNARYWWEYAHGLRKPGEYDRPNIVKVAPSQFAREIFLGALPGDEAGPKHPDSWASVQAWLEERHPQLLAAFEADYKRMPVPLEGTGQQDTLRLLPPGVRRVIKGYADRIQAQIDGRILWDKILGCGHYGCVVPIEGTDRVLKVTTDKTEGPVVQAILNTGLDKSLQGLVSWHEVWQIPGYEGRGARSAAYAIVRDAIEPLDEAIVHFGGGWMNELHAYNESARRMLTVKRPHLVDIASDIARESVQKLFHWEETYFVAEAIEALRADGILLADVHYRNLGFGNKSEMVTWADGKRRPSLLIFDPGHSQAPPIEVKPLP